MITAEETRVLGSLVEKQLATPQHYPLTENAVIAACNQATNRDPVVAFDQATVRRALVGLREQGLARLVHRPGDRTRKHAHRLDEALGLDPRELAVLALLLVRGPQTPGELRARAERLHPLETPDAVHEVLTGLAHRDGEALVAPLERRPGQKEVRYTELLSDEAPPPAEPPAASPGDGDEAATGDGDELAATVARLVEDVARLRAEVDELRSRLTGP